MQNKTFNLSLVVLGFLVLKIFTIFKNRIKMVEPSQNYKYRNDSSIFDMTGAELKLTVAELLQRVQYLERELEAIKGTVP